MSDMTASLVLILICLLIDGYRQRKEMKWSDDMADREKVVKGLNCCKHTDGVECPNCPYCQNCDCVEDMVTDVLKLLKEQEKQKFFVDENGKITPLPVVVRCKDCKHRPKEPDWKAFESGIDIEFPEGTKCPCYCSGDGWYSWYPEDDWFCANGERKDT